MQMHDGKTTVATLTGHGFGAEIAVTNTLRR